MFSPILHAVLSAGGFTVLQKLVMFMGPSVDPEGEFCAVGILLERLLSSLGFLGHPPCFF